MRLDKGHPRVPNLFLHSQFSKDVLVNIYSAYIDNFLNAKDAVRVAKEARPAFLKFLEVLWARAGGWRPLSPWASFGSPRNSHPGYHSPSQWVCLCPQAEWGLPGSYSLDIPFFCMSFLTWLHTCPALDFSKACVRTRRSRRCPTS